MSYLGNTPTQQAFTPAIDYFSGNGSTTAFTLSRPVASVAQVQAVIENVAQNPTSAFTVSGNTITFTSAPPSGTNNIYVYYTSPITQVAALPQNPQVFGNLQFSSAGSRITGDFSNATIANQVAFQTSITNGATNVNALPNGTGNIALFRAFDNSDQTNASFCDIRVTGATDARFTSSRLGTGTYLPMTFYTSGSERMRIDTSGNVGIGTNSPSSLNPNVTYNNVVAIAKSDQVLTLGAYYQAGVGQSAFINASQLGTPSNPTSFVIQTGGTERASIDLNSNFKFNSGYGSVATAYGCRAWVNFNGTGTVAITASGNVSSITDNGTGDYTVNFTTALPDANYATAISGSNGAGAGETFATEGRGSIGAFLKTTSAYRVNTLNYNTASLADRAQVNVSIFR